MSTSASSRTAGPYLHRLGLLLAGWLLGWAGCSTGGATQHPGRGRLAAGRPVSAAAAGFAAAAAARLAPTAELGPAVVAAPAGLPGVPGNGDGRCAGNGYAAALPGDAAIASGTPRQNCSSGLLRSMIIQANC